MNDFEQFAAKVAQHHDERPSTYLLEEGPEEQAKRVAERLAKFDAKVPLIPVADTVIDLAGFGEARIHFTSAEDNYLLLSEVADALGWPLQAAVKWADLQYDFALRDQRRLDEERGDGRLGYECMRDYVDLGIWAIVDDPAAKPDAGGKRYSHTGEWLISHDRLPALLMSSPWSKEFMDNSLPAFGHAMREIWGDKLKTSPVYGTDGHVVGNAYDNFFSTDGLTKDEAIERARRGPVLDEDDRQT